MLRTLFLLTFNKVPCKVVDTSLLLSCGAHIFYRGEERMANHTSEDDVAQIDYNSILMHNSQSWNMPKVSSLSSHMHARRQQHHRRELPPPTGPRASATTTFIKPTHYDGGCCHFLIFKMGDCCKSARLFFFLARSVSPNDCQILFFSK